LSVIDQGKVIAFTGPFTETAEPAELGAGDAHDRRNNREAEQSG
jgi:hypothetical protein